MDNGKENGNYYIMSHCLQVLPPLLPTLAGQQRVLSLFRLQLLVSRAMTHPQHNYNIYTIIMW